MTPTTIPCASTRRPSRRRSDHPCLRAPGFSLIELMVTIAIVAILLGLALPSLADTITRNRIAAAANDFVAGLNYARTEALRLNRPTGVCPSKTGVSCDNAWNEKWIVFSGDAGNPTVLRQSEFNTKDSFTSNLNTTLIQFDARGMLATNPDIFQLKPDSCAAGKPMLRVFSLRRTGNLSISKGDCT